MTKHTPGPWRLSGPDDFGDYTIQPPKEALAIAAVTNGEMWRMGGKFDEHSANANLIAAAPLMYEALANLENDDAERMPASAWKLVQDALKAARGEME
jgi:hypothetical protein